MGQIGLGRALLDPDLAREQGCSKRALAEAMDGVDQSAVCQNGGRPNISLKTLKRTYRRAKSITLILDNYIIHKSKKAQRWLASNPKFIVLFQPVYSPWVNRIERLWHALHETITRNHQYRTLDELLHRVRYFLDNAAPFPGNGHGLMQLDRN